MNCYLAYGNMAESVEVLDSVRLNRMRGGIVKLLKALAEPPPANGEEQTAIRMWRGNEKSLIRLGMFTCLEWQNRGNSDVTIHKMLAYLPVFADNTEEDPEWLGDPTFHARIRSYLLRSQPSHYRQYWPDEQDDLQMVWPRKFERASVFVVTSSNNLEKRRIKARDLADKAKKAAEKAYEACVSANLDPDTLEPLEDVEVDPALAAL